MEVFIEFNESAFRHNVSKEDICCALLNWKYDDTDEDDPDKHLLTGFDRNANLLEIMYNEPVPKLILLCAGNYVANSARFWNSLCVFSSLSGLRNTLWLRLLFQN